MSKLLDNIQRFVKSHGFEVKVNESEGVATIYIPMACDGEYCGDDVIEVRTAEEARAALGY